MSKLKELYEKTADFEKKLSPEVAARSHCQKGCAQCCHTDISVFGVEASLIRNWFQGLSETEKNSIRESWSQPRAAGACTFLRNNACTIYEARPLICRTQGLALKFIRDHQAYIDICPLNESMLESIASSEVMNLDLLNQMLSTIESMDAGNTPRERIRLEYLKKELDNQD